MQFSGGAVLGRSGQHTRMQFRTEGVHSAARNSKIESALSGVRLRALTDLGSGSLFWFLGVLARMVEALTCDSPGHKHFDDSLDAIRRMLACPAVRSANGESLVQRCACLHKLNNR
jgi:hypothetical protein